MSKGTVNKVILIGNLGADPEVRYTQGSNIPVCNLSVATTKTWNDQAGQKQERTEWHKVTLYRKLAEIAGEYLHKGSTVYVEGELSTRKWQDKEGQDRYTTEIICSEMQMLGGKGQANGQPNGANPPPQSRPQQGQNGGQNGGGQQRPPQNQARQNQPQGGQFDDFGFEGPEDDIPF